MNVTVTPSPPEPDQMVAVGLLSRLGFEADVVSIGQQAVEAVARTRYVVVLMDCNMPVMDGYQATAAIQAAGSGRGPPTDRGRDRQRPGR